jgi:hypothetical protein
VEIDKNHLLCRFFVFNFEHFANGWELENLTTTGV